MSKIVVVQPDRMLQQAFMMALFPEHEVKMLDVLPEVAPKDFAAMIVDTAALFEYGSLTGRDLKMLQSFDMPLLLIEADGASEIADREKLVRIKRPVAKGSLQKALADCLSGATGRRTEAANPAEPAMKPKSKTKKRKKSPLALSPINYIELTDVVEEGDVTLVGTPQAQKKI